MNLLTHSPFSGGRRGPLLTVLALLAVAVPAQAATYYVSKSGSDSNPCATATSSAQSQQKQTITAGLRCLQAAGDTLTIHAGVYAEQIFETSFGTTGTAAAYLTVQAAPGETVILRPSGGSGNVARFQDNSVHHVILKDLHLDGIHAGGGGGGAVVTCSNDYMRLENLEIYNGDGNGLLCGGHYNELRNLRVHHNGLSTAYLISIGAYMVGSHTTIIGGEYFDNECYGIRFWDSDHSKTSDNNTVDGVKIYNNGFHVAWGGASQCAADGGGVTLADNNNVVKNSLIFNNYHGIYIHDYKLANDLRFYNNTITGNRIYGLYIPGQYSTPAKRTIYTNNILFANAVANLSDSGQSSVAATNLLTDPSFADAAGQDYHLRATSAARDTGTTVPAVTTDYAGMARTAGAAYDIGAYEYGASGARLGAPGGVTLTVGN